MTDFTLSAKNRDDLGKGASRRLRRLEDLVPAVVYGAGKPAQSVSLVHKDLFHALENEAFYSHVIALDIDGNIENVLLKDLQRHPAKPVIIHADFLRVDMNKKVTVRVPLHFINEDSSIGVKQQGGKVTHNVTEIEVSCLPANLPEFLEVDLANVEIETIVHISDITLPEGVESVALSHGEDHDLPVAAIHAAKGGSDDAEEATEEENSED